MPRMRRWSSVVVALAAPALCATTACATAPAAPAAAPSPASDEPEGPLPAPARQYTTTALPDGVSGGPRAEQLAREVRAALRARGDDAVADGALAPVAMWL